jgi:hypothetical protein
MPPNLLAAIRIRALKRVEEARRTVWQKPRRGCAIPDDQPAYRAGTARLANKCSATCNSRMLRSLYCAHTPRPIGGCTAQWQTGFAWRRDVSWRCIGSREKPKNEQESNSPAHGILTGVSSSFRKSLKLMARETGLEPATSGVTGRN